MTVSQEVEAKFAVSHLGEMRRHLLQHGARLIRDRVLERNWRFDDPKGTLTANDQVLRLRQDLTSTLTFKQATDDPMARQEIEFEVSQVDSARSFLEALGYQTVLIYEKYRETFALGGCSIVLDQLPFGQFVEIESSTSQAVIPVIRQLGFRQQDQVIMSYAELFAEWKRRTGNNFRDATFAAFEGIEPISPEDLGLVDCLPTPLDAAEQSDVK